MAALRQRVTLALRLAPAGKNILSSEAASELAGLARLLAAVGAEMPRAREIGSKLGAFSLLAQNRGSHSNPDGVDEALSALAAELKSLIAGIQERLQPFPYPFPHARGRLTVAEYARSEKPAEFELQRVYQEGVSHVDRLFALHYRLVGRILVHADAGETSLEKQ
jgi:hypothetical protein